jgi:hypothetical protein
MISSFNNISNNLSCFSQNVMRDTVYVINLNQESEFIKLIPIILAFVAILFTAYSIFISKRALTANIKHQKLSVRPLLTSLEEFSLRNSEGIGIIMKSCGLGPAIVKDFKMYWDNTEINFENAVIVTEALKLKRIGIGNLTKDGIIEKDLEKWIICIPKDQLQYLENTIPNNAGKMLKIIREKFSYTIIYTSIYGDEDSEITLKYPFHKVYGRD